MKNVNRSIFIIMVYVLFVSVAWAESTEQTSKEKRPNTWDLIRKAQTKQTKPADMVNEERVVHFPKDRSLGKLFIQDMKESDEFAYWFHWTRIGEESRYLCQARGDVRVPVGMRLILAINPAVLNDLSGLKKLGPDDLYGIVFDASPRHPARATDDSLSYLTHLTGLKSLNISRTDITDVGMKYVANLKSLESLEMPNRVTGRGMIFVGQLSLLKRL